VHAMFKSKAPLVPAGATKVVLSDKGLKDLPAELRTCRAASFLPSLYVGKLTRDSVAVAADQLQVLNLSLNKLSSACYPCPLPSGRRAWLTCSSLTHAPQSCRRRWRR
jgi:hypothetical protein